MDNAKLQLGDIVETKKGAGKVTLISIASVIVDLEGSRGSCYFPKNSVKKIDKNYKAPKDKKKS